MRCLWKNKYQFVKLLRLFQYQMVKAINNVTVKLVSVDKEANAIAIKTVLSVILGVIKEKIIKIALTKRIERKKKVNIRSIIDIFFII